MLPRPACYRAVQRHINPCNFWTSEDDAIADAYNNFSAASKIRKRYGSFCPGPLESQRRIGKRRMAYGLQQIPTSRQSLWSWWRSFREVDYTQWKWEPPRLAAMVREPCPQTPQPALPAWLLASYSTIKQYTSSPKALDLNNNRCLLYEERLALGTAIHDGSIDNIMEAYLNFTQALGRVLSKDIYCGKELVYILNETTEELLTKGLDSSLAHSLCYFVYQTVWRRLVTSNPRTSAATMSLITVALLRGLSKLKSTYEVQGLISAIIQSCPQLENKALYHELFQTIVTSWALSWRNENCMDNKGSRFELDIFSSERSQKTSEDIILRVEQMVSETENLIRIEKRQDVRSFTRELKLKILSSLEAIEKAEDIIIPAKLSATSLAQTLNHLPQDRLKDLLQECSRKICEIIQNGTERHEDVKIYWLFSISQLSNLHDREFLNLWKYMDKNSVRLYSKFYPELLINRWACQGSLEHLELVKNTIKTISFGDDNISSWVSLIYAIYQSVSKELHFRKIGYILGMLNALGDFEAIGEIILRLSKLSPRLPAEILEFVVEITTDHNPGMAWNIAMLSETMKPGRKYRSKIYPRGDYRTIRYSYCPKFVMWMISNPKLKPRYIWRILRVPIHAKYSARYRNQPSSKPLNLVSVNLFRKMATAFAYSERLSPRVAFRNVMQCWHHLRHYKTPLDKTLTKALVHSGLARCIEMRQWVPKERLNWLLYLVKEAEGIKVAVEVEQAVVVWNAEIAAKQSRLRRELNVLKVGPID